MYRGFALGKKTRQKNCAFDLSTRDRRAILNSAQRTPTDAERRCLLRPLRHNISSHLAQRRDNSIVRPARQRSISDEAAFEGLTGEQPRQQSHCGAGVSAVDFLLRRSEDTFFSVNNNYLWLRLVDFDSQSAQRVERVHTIIARKKPAQRTRAVRQSGDDRRAMGNTLVARDRDLSVASWRSLDPQFHRRSIFRGWRSGAVLIGAGVSASDIRCACPASLLTQFVRVSE